VKLQQSTIEGNHSDVLSLLKICPRFWQLLWLPWWYDINRLYLNVFVRKARKENPPGPFCLAHARLLSAYYCDRKYIDVMLKHARVAIETGEEKRWVQAYLDVGMTLCDLGHFSEGISYIEKAIALEKRPSFRNKCILHLCYRLSSESKYEKAVELAKTLLNDEPKNSIAKMVLVKASIDSGMLKGEYANIRELVTEYPKAFGFLLAEFHFSLKDFKAASDAFDKYDINRRLSFWLAEYDYKKAVAYYYSDQQDKCKRQTAKIKRRMKWDRFYKMDAIEKAGVERVSAIDKMIQSGEVDKSIFDREKTLHYFKTIGHIMRLYLEFRWYIILLLIVLIFFLVKLRDYLL
jgi:hypothetical protein